MFQDQLSLIEGYELIYVNTSISLLTFRIIRMCLNIAASVQMMMHEFSKVANTKMIPQIKQHFSLTMVLAVNQWLLISGQ